MSPNRAVNRTTGKRCLPVPFALRASAADYRDRYAALKRALVIARNLWP